MSSPTSSSIDDALRAYVRESAPEMHPSFEDLETFQAGHLPAKKAERIEEHLGLCAECTERLLDLTDFLDDGAEKPSKIEVARAWRRHQEIRKLRSPRRWTPFVIASTLAATFLLTSVGLGIWNHALRQGSHISGPLQRAVLPSDSIRGPEDRVVIHLERGRDVILQLQPKTLEEPDVASYRAVFLDASEQELYEVTGARGQDPDILLRPPWTRFSAGTYRVVLSAVGDKERPWDEFEFEIDLK